MKFAEARTVLRPLVMGAAAFVAATSAFGQGTTTDLPSAPPTPSASVSPVVQKSMPPDQGAEGSEKAFVLAQPPFMMNYQGYLTDDDGSPLNGAYDMEFRLYDEPVGGFLEWGPESHVGVTVTNGLFQVALGSVTALLPADFDKALYLAVSVEGSDLSPRQPLRAVPYAFGLVPGAEVEGEPTGSSYALRVTNTGTGSSDRGLYAAGEQYGLYAEEVGPDSDTGIYSPDYVRAKGYRSIENSYFWVPGNAAILYPTTGCTLYNQSYGSVRLECSAAGGKHIDLPIPAPGPLFGQDVTVESIRVFYDLDSTGSYIDRTLLNKQTAAGQAVPIVDDNTNRISISPTSYTLTAVANNTLTTSAGVLNLHLIINHDGNANHDVNIGGVRVELKHID